MSKEDWFAFSPIPWIFHDQDRTKPIVLTNELSIDVIPEWALDKKCLQMTNDQEYALLTGERHGLCADYTLSHKNEFYS